MKKVVILLAGVFVAASLLWLASPPQATANQPTGSFSISPPNTAEQAATGNTIRVAGSGSFDAVGATVLGSGAFTRFTAAGAVIDRGTWKATEFVDFDSFGGPNPGFQGGVLTIEVTLFPTAGPPEPNLTMVVTCCVFGPASCEEGTTVGAFTEITGGLNLFHVTP